MSILGAMNTAVSGLAAQSAAFGNISNNVANSQTVGFKGVDTTFSDYLTTSTATVNDPGTVVAAPQYLNTVQGTISQSQNALALAVSGQGFFDVSKAAGTGTNGQTLFATQQYYTRDGDFQLNASGYLTNESGMYLNGWLADPTTGVLDKSNIKQIQVAQTVYAPVATQNMTMNANLPTGYHLGVNANNQTEVLDSTNTQVQTPTSQVSVYDSQGNLHQLTLTWTPTALTATQSAPWALSIADTTNGGDTPILGGTPTAAQAAAAAAATTKGAADQKTLTQDQANLATAKADPTLTDPGVQTAIGKVQTVYDQLGQDQAALAANPTDATLLGKVGTDMGNLTAPLAALTVAVNALPTPPTTALTTLTNVWNTTYGPTTPTPTATTPPTGDTYALAADNATIAAGTAPGAAMVTFGADGTLQSVAYTDPTGKAVTIAATAANANPLADLNLQTQYPTPTGKQSISLNLGNIGKTNGVTQFAASSYTLRSLSQDGVPPGSFSNITTNTTGDIFANYDNGQTRLIGQVPLATFGNADALQSQNGSAYTVTNASGNPSLQDAGSNGAGSLVTSSVESSNVDIAAEFSKLIIAQQAYTANTKVVTTADQLMQSTINMKT